MEEEEAGQLSPDEILWKCQQELHDRKEDDIANGFRFPDEEFTILKYESNDIKNLKNLTVSKYILTIVCLHIMTFNEFIFFLEFNQQKSR